MPQISGLHAVKWLINNNVHVTVLMELCRWKLQLHVTYFCNTKWM